jgi:thioesterase domain-containing protein
MGGLVAVEMARLLETRGREVALVVVVDTPLAGTGGDTERQLASYLREMLGDEAVDALDGVLTAAIARAEREGIGAAIEQLLAEAGDAAAGQAGLARVFAANVTAMQAYRAAPYGGRVCLFVPDDPSGDDGFADPSDDWARVAAGLEVERVPGTHYSLLREPHVTELATRLRSRLAAVA